ncbi:MAG: GspH/FimT family protein [Gammaproteobacteria bacterium]|nr:GspH/FimT family protein [Gammaproteobacteria bacterium]
MLKAVTETTRIFHCNTRQPASLAGFSLVELLVVLVLLVAALAIAPPYFKKGISSAELKSSVRLIAAGLRSAQAQALARKQEAVFILDVEKQQFSIGNDGRSNNLPDALQLRLKTAESEQISDVIGGIRFFPDGSSTGGSITVTGDAGAQRVSIDWITGKVTIDDASE